MTELRASREIKFAVIADAQGRADGDHGYTLYYVAGDKDRYGEGRWILEDNAGVTCTNYNLTDVYRNQGEELDAEGDRLEGEINAIINSDAGEIVNYYTGTGTQGGAGSEAEDLMRQWGWIARLMPIRGLANSGAAHPTNAEKGVSQMKFTNRDICDIDVDFAVRKIVTGAPETYTWKPEDDSKVREWLDETVEAESLMDARLDADSLPEFLIKLPILMSTTEAAEALGISVQRIKQLCGAGRMGRKVGDTWVITPEDIEANRVRKPAGRPAKAATQFNLAYVTPDTAGRYITASVVDPDFTRDIDLPRGVRLLDDDAQGYPRVRFPAARLLMGSVLDIGPLRK